MIACDIFYWNCTFAVATTHANMDTWWSSDSSFSYNVIIKPFLGNDYRVFAAWRVYFLHITCLFFKNSFSLCNNLTVHRLSDVLDYRNVLVVCLYTVDLKQWLLIVVVTFCRNVCLSIAAEESVVHTAELNYKVVLDVAGVFCPSCYDGINGEFDPVTGNFHFCNLGSVGM